MVQIERVAANLRAEVSTLGWSPLGPVVGWSPNATPPSAAALLQPYVDVLQTELVRNMSDALGIDYSIPVIGWAIAIMDLIIEILYAIFGTASGVQTQAVPLAEGEQDGWQSYMAAVVVCLQVLDDECRTLTLPGRRGMFASKAGVAETKRTKTARTVVAIGLGTGVALAIAWALLG